MEGNIMIKKYCKKNILVMLTMLIFLTLGLSSCGNNMCRAVLLTFITGVPDTCLRERIQGSRYCHWHTCNINNCTNRNMNGSGGMPSYRGTDRCNNCTLRLQHDEPSNAQINSATICAAVGCYNPRIENQTGPIGWNLCYTHRDECIEYGCTNFAGLHGFMRQQCSQCRN